MTTYEASLIRASIIAGWEHAKSYMKKREKKREKKAAVSLTARLNQSFNLCSWGLHRRCTSFQSAAGAAAGGWLCMQPAGGLHY